MPGQIENLRKLAKKDPKKVVLPEGNDPRIVEAAGIIAGLGLADVTLIGKEKEVKRLAAANSDSLKNVNIIDPAKYAAIDETINTFYNLRKHKGITPDDARKAVLENPLYFGALMVRAGEAHGFVAGANHKTSDVARAAIYCLGVKRSIGIMSSAFVVELDNCSYGDDGLFVFADCAIVPDPSAGKLAGIAISTSKLYKRLFKRAPRIALLSYSTQGSAKGEAVEKVREALKKIKEKAPDLMVDGELQFDAAVVPEVAKIKAPKSPLGGRANILIFPNLAAGNIAYKLVQRLGKGRVLGPLLQGINNPASDLSRGCLVEEIVDTVVAIVLRAQKC